MRIPHSSELEAAYVGALLGAPAAIGEAVRIAGPEALYVPRYRKILEVLVELDGRGEPIDLTIIASRLPSMNGSAHRQLLELQAAASWANWPNYAQRLADLDSRRRLQAMCSAVARAADTGTDDELAEAQRDLAAELARDSATDLTSAWGRVVDLGPFIDGQADDDSPTMLARQDGVALLYPAKNHSFHGESESGKSWMALLVCEERLGLGEHVLYLDFEDSPASVVERLRALGVPLATLRERFHYQRIDEPLGACGPAALDRLLARLSPTVVVLDGITEALVVNGWSFKDNDDIARFITAVPRRINRAGAATVMIDHVGRDKDTRGRFAIGAQHKLSGLDGAAYTFDVLEPFGRGRHGIARITMAKDRPGHVRRHADSNGQIGEFHLAADDKGAVTLAELRAPADADQRSFRPTVLMERVSYFLERAGAPQSGRRVEDNVSGTAKYIRQALAALVEDGYVTVSDGPSNSRLHTIKTPYRAASGDTK